MFIISSFIPYSALFCSSERRGEERGHLTSRHVVCADRSVAGLQACQDNHTITHIKYSVFVIHLVPILALQYE